MRTARAAGVWGRGGVDAARSGRADPHLWLDPENAKAWTAAIAETLAALDPENAAHYRANAAAAEAELDALSSEIAAALAPVQGRPFLVFHDAYQYFERRFDLAAVGAVALGDAERPSPKRLSRLRTALESSGAACAFTEPQFSPKLLLAAADGLPIRIGELDPVGRGLKPGSAFYPALMRGLAVSFRGCLEPRSEADQ